MGRGQSTTSGRVLLPSAREALSGLGAAVLSLAAGYLVLFVSDLSAWLGGLLLAGGVALFGVGVRAGMDLQRHYEEGGRVTPAARLSVWALAGIAGVGALGAVLLALALVVPGFA